MTDRGRRIRRALDANAELVARLEREHARLVAASDGSNADDEHDPEGATIAWEREQLHATLERAGRARRELEAALQALDRGEYGTCEGCGGPIDPDRLDAVPQTRLCIGCASARRR